MPSNIGSTTAYTSSQEKARGHYLTYMAEINAAHKEALAKQQEADAKAAEKPLPRGAQTTTPEGYRTSGPPVAMDEVVVEAPNPDFDLNYEEADAANRNREEEFAYETVKNMALGGLAVFPSLGVETMRLGHIGHSLLTQGKMPDWEKYGGEFPLEWGSWHEWTKRLGGDPDSLGAIAGSFLAGAKGATNVGEAFAQSAVRRNPAGGMSILAMNYKYPNKEEMLHVARVVKEVKTRENMAELRKSLDPADLERWNKANEEIYRRTGGFFYDTSGIMRKHLLFTDNMVNPNLVSSLTGKVKKAPFMTLEDVYHPSVWDNFTPASAERYKRIPVRTDYAQQGAEWDKATGIHINWEEHAKDPAEFMNSIGHELEHAFSQVMGGEKGGAPNEFDWGYRTSREQLEAQARVARANGDDGTNAAIDLIESMDMHGRKGFASFTESPHWRLIEGTLNRTAEGKQYLIELERTANDWKRVFQDYQDLAGEVLARLSPLPSQGKYPFARIGEVGSSFEGMRRDLYRRPMLGTKGLPQTIKTTDDLGNVTLELIRQGATAADIKAGKFDDFIRQRSVGPTGPNVNSLPQEMSGADEIAAEIAAMTPEEKADALRREIAAQKGDAGRDRSIPPTYYQREELKKAQEGIKAAQPDRERINEAFPKVNREVVVGEKSPLAPEGQSIPNTERTVQTTKPRDTQGGKKTTTASILADQDMFAGLEKADLDAIIRGDMPAGISPYDNLLRDSNVFAVGDEAIWKSPRFDAEKYRQSVAKFKTQQARELAKVGKKETTAKSDLVPKMWVYDEETGKVWVVKMGDEGKLVATPKSGPSIKPKDFEKIDVRVKDRKGLDEYLAYVQEERGAKTPEPIAEVVARTQPAIPQRSAVLEQMQREMNALAFPKVEPPGRATEHEFIGGLDLPPMGRRDFKSRLMDVTQAAKDEVAATRPDPSGMYPVEPRGPGPEPLRPGDRKRLRLPK